MDPILPIRRKLPHAIPTWVNPGASFFLTLCSRPRGLNQLCHDAVAQICFDSVRFRQDRGDWYVHLLLLMPDHLHAIASFPGDRGMTRVIQGWKMHLAKTAGLTWQDGFFDHRLRDTRSFEEKAAYIRNNPVRAGLIQVPGQWRFVWFPDEVKMPGGYTESAQR